MYKPERWIDDALFRMETRDAFERLISQGWTRALRALHPEGTTYTYFDFRNLLGPGADLIAMRLQRGDGAAGFARSTQNGGDGRYSYQPELTPRLDGVATQERLRPPGGHKSKNNLSAPAHKRGHDIKAQAGAEAEHTLVLLSPFKSASEVSDLIISDA